MPSADAAEHQIFAIECFEDRVVRAELTIRQGTTLIQALESLLALPFAPLVDRMQDQSLDELVAGNLGVNGLRAKLDQVLNACDRIEFYRPLIIDNKKARQLLVENQRRQRATARSQPKKPL